jgi:hypothetical protein
MTDTPAHTPLPWAAQPLETGDDAGVSIIGSDLGGLVCASLPWPTEIDSGDYSRVEANAVFIVRACNSHYQLVEALRDLLALAEIRYPTPAPNGQIARARAALSQAGGAGE